eukprot:TRINITY_DN106532_c0_g1_i1.p1 TRINITY_DN106532_c0_g1~~TRINITY_DN106532_c0_g1_i1.p1  ORF type:complete len:557 (+),score=92.00 TRINITY_DN106532_c0_g1_i1:43-1713(+)
MFTNSGLSVCCQYYNLDWLVRVCCHSGAMQKAKSPARPQAKKVAPAPAAPKRQPAQKAAADSTGKSIATTASQGPVNIRGGQRAGEVGGSRSPSLKSRQGSSGLTPRGTDRKKRPPEETKAAVSSSNSKPATEELGRQDGERASDGEQKPAVKEVDRPAEEQKLGEPPQALIADIGGTQLGDMQGTIASPSKLPSTNAADAAKVQGQDAAGLATDGVAKTKEVATAPLSPPASETEQVPSSTSRPASRPSDVAPATTLEALQLENLRLRQEVERQKSQIEQLRSSGRTVEAANILEASRSSGDQSGPQASPAVEVRTQPNLATDLLTATTQLVAAPCPSSTPRAQCSSSNPATPCPSSSQQGPCTSSSPRVGQKIVVCAPTGTGVTGTVDAVRAPLSARGSSSVPVPPPPRQWPVPVPGPGGYLPVFASPVTPYRTAPTAPAPASPRLPAEQAPSPVWAKMAAVYNAQGVRPATTAVMQGRFMPVPANQQAAPRPFATVAAWPTSASHQNIPPSGPQRTMPACSPQHVCFREAPAVTTPRGARSGGNATVRSASAS